MLLAWPAQTMAYRAYGLTIASDFPLPFPEVTAPKPDVLIRRSASPPVLTDPAAASGVGWTLTAHAVQVTVAGAGQFVINAREIVVTPQEGTGPELMTAVLLDGCLAALLYLRGRLVLRAAAVEVPGCGAVALTGHSGSGKSTVALGCALRGWHVITDHLAAVQVDADGVPMLAAGGPVIHAWRDALEFLALNVAEVARIRPQLEKYAVPVRHVTWGAAPLAAIVVLEVSELEDPRPRPVQGASAFALLREHLRSKRLAEAVNRPAIFRQLAALAGRVPVFRIARPDLDHSALAPLIDTLLQLPT